MKTLFSLVAFLSFLQFAAPATAEVVFSGDLVDPASKDHEDPYLDLEREALDGPSTVAVETSPLDAEGLSEEERASLSLEAFDVRTVGSVASRTPTLGKTLKREEI